jgi:dihydrofolate synthase/folylpolyglutamate synthase
VVLGELKKMYPQARPRVALFACARDKAVGELLFLLGEWADEVVFTNAHSPRGCAPEELRALWQSGAGRGKKVHTQAELAAGWREAEKLAGPDGLALAIGSLYLVGALAGRE